MCSASALIINTVNAIEKFTDMEASLVSDEEEGFIQYELKSRPSKESSLLLKTMVLGLSEMAHEEDYAKYIDLTFEEV